MTAVRFPVPFGRKFRICLIKYIPVFGISLSVKWPTTGRISLSVKWPTTGRISLSVKWPTTGRISLSVKWPTTGRISLSVKWPTTGRISLSVKWPTTGRITEDAWIDVQQGQRICLCPKPSSPVLEPTQPPSHRESVAPAPVVKCRGVRAEHPTSPSVEVKNEWNCNSVPPTCFRGTNRDHLTFTACKVPHLLQPLNFTEFIPFCYAIHEYGKSAACHLLARQVSLHVFSAACPKSCSTKHCEITKLDHDKQQKAFRDVLHTHTHTHTHTEAMTSL